MAVEFVAAHNPKHPGQRYARLVTPLNPAGASSSRLAPRPPRASGDDATCKRWFGLVNRVWPSMSFPELFLRRKRREKERICFYSKITNSSIREFRSGKMFISTRCLFISMEGAFVSILSFFLFPLFLS